MRIISGKFQGRTINAPNKIPARPTTDFAKTGLFNILGNHFDFSSISVLDLYSGTGSISFEFASREAEMVTAVEQNFRCSKFIKEEADKLGMKNLVCQKNEVFAFLKNCNKNFDIVFADPPYESKETKNIVPLIHEKKMLKENGWLIIEHSERENFSQLPGYFESRHYGNVNFSFFKSIE